MAQKCVDDDDGDEVVVDDDGDDCGDDDGDDVVDNVAVVDFFVICSTIDLQRNYSYWPHFTM